MSIRPFESIFPNIAETAFIDSASTVIGDVKVGHGSSIWPGAVIRGDVNTIRIGERTSIQDGVIIHATHAGPFSGQGFATIIGDDVTVGHQAIIHGCTIQDRVLVGMGSKILDGAVIESDSMIGAGSLVPPGKKLESGFLYYGSPVSQIRLLDEKELDFLCYMAEHYVKLAQRH
ncbi:MAG: gamma carbonic anhydrase family protein [Coxiellaceae bacterium]|nr:gamma carbonic anhydrase family protein [Coxiellaceae bacterium]|tara:strand:- start:3288 stop:3809 length:522 start_codon:yes stop_codon:yes gene_type:complete